MKNKTAAASAAAAISPEQQRRWLLRGMVASLALFLAIYLLRLDRVVGLFGDDAWYVLLARALAVGQGYTLSNSPSAQIMPFYPPGYSFLLSLAWRIYGQFPQNVWLLKSLSMAAMLGVGALVYLHFWRERQTPRWLALASAFAVVSSPAFAFLATSTLMSECVFTLLQLAVVVVVERCVRETAAPVWRWALAGGWLAGAAFLTRSAAAALIVAVTVYLLRQRLPRALGIFLGAAALLIGPWLIYSRLHAPAAEQQAEQNSYIVQSYAQQFWQRKAGFTTEGTITLDELPQRVWENTYHLLEYDFGALILYPLYRAIEPSEGRLRYWWHDYTSWLLSALILLGFAVTARRRFGLAEWMVVFSLAIIVAWPFRPYRFVLPLLPWALAYLLAGAQTLAQGLARYSQKPESANAAAVGLGLLIAVNLWSNASYIISLHGPAEARPKWVRMFDENEKLIEWVGRNLPRDAVLTSQNPALLHLYTGHKAVGSTEPGRNWELWKRLKVRYYALTSYFPLGAPPESEQRFKQLYHAPETHLRVLDFGEAATRPAWPE